jgi:hybrid cluster-associated redox disulfide protein
MKISKDMTIGEIVRNYPSSAGILASFGLGCVGCPSAQAETLEEACQVHAMKVDELIKALNANIE